MSNLWILTEERPKSSDIATILTRTAEKLGLHVNITDIWFELLRFRTTLSIINSQLWVQK